ncbi:NAD(P)-dependent oxidoreductase [Frankia sp. CiP3]|uniref:NAD(P)-dependent oxidoreductase n=1 Tax=Frankia sp. CiP3 TaxID=2880971 RepID=UPI001EF452FA|nr:NAD(P)H-binding protein [Frankia sp. CiP3]
MSGIAVFGAGGRAGRRIVAEAVSRGEKVTAVVRDPIRHADLESDNVRIAVGDVTDLKSVAALAEGHRAAVTAVYRSDVPADKYYSEVARAMIGGLGRAGVPRLVVLGIGTLLESSPGVRFMDQPEFPPDYLPFNEGRVLELNILRESGGELDWVVVVAPPSPLDNETPRTGRYQITGTRLLPYDNGDGPRFDFPYNAKGPLFTFTDLAVALVDEALTPRHHRELVGVSH